MFGGTEGRVVFGVFIHTFYELCRLKDVRGKAGFWGFHGFIKFCSLIELWWNTGKIGFWSFHGFMKFCWLKDIWWNRGKGGFWV